MAAWLRHTLTVIGVWTARPIAFLIVLIYAVFWIVFDRESFDWHGAATLATWLMTLVIQRAEHRDTQALHGKLDELLRVHDRAQDGLTKLDEQEAEDIERHREERRPA